MQRARARRAAFVGLEQDSLRAAYGLGFVETRPPYDAAVGVAWGAVTAAAAAAASSQPALDALGLVRALRVDPGKYQEAIVAPKARPLMLLTRRSGDDALVCYLNAAAWRRRDALATALQGRCRVPVFLRLDADRLEETLRAVVARQANDAIDVAAVLAGAFASRVDMHDCCAVAGDASRCARACPKNTTLNIFGIKPATATALTLARPVDALIFADVARWLLWELALASAVAMGRAAAWSEPAYVCIGVQRQRLLRTHESEPRRGGDYCCAEHDNYELSEEPCSEQNGGEHCSDHGGEHCSHGSDHGGEHCSEHGGGLCSEHGGGHCSEHGGGHCSEYGGGHCSEHGGKNCSDENCSEHGDEHCSEHGGGHCSEHGGKNCSDKNWFEHGDEHCSDHDDEPSSKHGDEHCSEHVGEHSLASPLRPCSPPPALHPTPSSQPSAAALIHSPSPHLAAHFAAHVDNSSAAHGRDHSEAHGEDVGEREATLCAEHVGGGGRGAASREGATAHQGAAQQCGSGGLGAASHQGAVQQQRGSGERLNDSKAQASLRDVAPSDSAGTKWHYLSPDVVTATAAILGASVGRFIVY